MGKDRPQLIHFTDERGVAGILANGFALMPCDRLLLDDLFGSNRPFAGDPQNFGMVCFTEASLEDAGPVRKKGDYGIAVKFEWAEKHGARKVQYVGKAAAWVLRFKFRYQARLLTQKIGSPCDKGMALAYENKEFAGLLGAQGYQALLERYEYMQTARDRLQREWRITQKYPFQGVRPKEVPNEDGWSGLLRYKKIRNEDVEFLICPIGMRDNFLKCIPDEFRTLDIVELN